MACSGTTEIGVCEMIRQVKAVLKEVLPPRVILWLKLLRYWRDYAAVIGFLLCREFSLPLRQRLRMVKQLYVIHFSIESPHQHAEILEFIKAILSVKGNTDAVFVEAGCYKGSSTAKFSLAAEIAGRTLVVFDSFDGVPYNSEPHGKDIFGNHVSFGGGNYRASLEEVQCNVTRYGNIKTCRFVKGWLEDTLPNFKEKVAAIYLDVDLASSTRTCLKYLYPLLQPGGVLFSQDGHLPLVIEVFKDESFWTQEIGCKPPFADGLGSKKLIKIIKGVTT